MVVVDRFTKFAHFISLTHPYSAQEVARVFLDQVMKLHIIPNSIVSDRDKIFTSLLWQELMRSLGVKLKMSTTYHPQMDGQTKRVNQCVEGYLICLCFLHPKGWHKWVSLAQQWYSSSHHASIKRSPFKVLFGYQPPLLPTVEENTTVAIVEAYLEKRQRVLQQLKEELALAQNHTKQYVDRRSRREFDMGERVYLKLRPTHLKTIARGQ